MENSTESREDKIPVKKARLSGSHFNSDSSFVGSFDSNGQASIAVTVDQARTSLENLTEVVSNFSLLTEENAELRRRVDELKRASDLLKDENAELKRQVEELVKERVKLNEQIRGAPHHLDAAGQIEGLQDEIAALNQLFRVCKQENEGRIAKLEQRVEELVKESSELKIAGLKRLITACEQRNKGPNAELRQQVEALMKECGELKKLISSTPKHRDLVSEIIKLQDEIAALNQLLEACRQEVKCLRQAGGPEDAEKVSDSSGISGV